MVTPILPAAPALPPAPTVPWRARDRAPNVLVVGAIGHRVPRGRFVGRVHSTFAQACNIACGDTLLSLVGPGIGHGPTSLCIAEGAVHHDLRRLFAVGEQVHSVHGVVRAPHSLVDLTGARTWWPAPSGKRLPREQLHARLQHATAQWAVQRRQRASVLDHQAAAAAAALVEACRACDGASAARQAERLIGWGEGLTPAGDDFVVGVCAGLDALLDADDVRRQACRTALAAAMRASAIRTTAISAHVLRLAADGHYNERLLTARDALLCDVSQARTDRALVAACAVGATSGTDMVAGLLAALVAWSPAPSAMAAH